MDWISVKDRLPPMGEIIEGLGPKDWFYNRFGRDYFALVKINSKLIWITPSLNDMDYNELEITHWRNIASCPNGSYPYVKIKKYNGFWEPQIVFKKIKCSKEINGS